MCSGRKDDGCSYTNAKMGRYECDGINLSISKATADSIEWFDVVAKVVILIQHADAVQSGHVH